MDYGQNLEKDVSSEEDFRDAIDRWLADRDMMAVICEGFRQFRVENPLLLFAEKIVRYGTSEVMTESSLTTGAACFYCGLALRLLHDHRDLTTLPKQLDALFSFTMLYMLADHYLDDSQVKQSSKDELVKQIEIAMTTNESSDHPLVVHYRKIIELIPEAKEPLQLAIRSELQSCKVQKIEGLTREQYREMAYDKGGTSVQILQAIMGIYPDDAGYQLGACIQIVDDIIDVDDDAAERIHTMMTESEFLDEAFVETVHQIDGLPNEYNIFKPALMLMLLYGLAESSQRYSSSFLEGMQDYVIERKIEVRRLFYSIIMNSIKSFEVGR